MARLLRGTKLVLARASLGKESSANAKAAPTSKPDIQSAFQEQAVEEFTPPKFAWSIGSITMSAPSGSDPPSENNARKPSPTRMPMLPWPLQAKLEIGAVDDPLEHEADRAAEQVMRMPDPAAPAVAAMSRATSRAASGVPTQSASRLALRRKCSCGGSCDKCKAEQADDEHGKVQRKPAVPETSNLGASPLSSRMSAPPIVHEVLRSPGQPLDPRTRAFMEPRFGYDFSGVRVHAGAAAEQSARDISAAAYAVGENIVFGAGQFAPQQLDGRKLLAHELAHVVQQGRQNPATCQGSGKHHAGHADGSVGSGNAQMVRTSAVSGTVQRQAATGPIARQAAQKKSRLVRIERYWRSSSARAFFEDGSNEEVTFVEAGSLDPASQPQQAYEKVAKLTIDRSSPIRPHVEFASHSSGSRVKVVTRPSPADRISKLPANVRRELSQAFLNNQENESNPQTMEFAADMGDRLKETSGTTKIEMEGRDPATLARMQIVDQWVSKQQSELEKLGRTRRARFTQLLSDVRRIGVTGPAAVEDLSAQDIELVLAGAAGGQSNFRTFDDFKRGMQWRLRSGEISLPAEMENNPDFFIRNEYRREWKTEASGLRRMSRIAAAAQVAPFAALGASAAVGAGGALILGGGGGAAASGGLAAGEGAVGGGAAASGGLLDAASWAAYRAAPRLVGWAAAHPVLAAEIGGSALTLGEKAAEGDLSPFDVAWTILTLGHANLSDEAMMRPSGGVGSSVPTPRRAPNAVGAAFALGMEQSDVLPRVSAGGASVTDDRPVAAVVSPPPAVDLSETTPGSARPATPATADPTPTTVATPKVAPVGDPSTAGADVPAAATQPKPPVKPPAAPVAPAAGLQGKVLPTISPIPPVLSGVQTPTPTAPAPNTSAIRPSGSMRKPPGRGQRYGMTSTTKTLDPHKESTPVVEVLPRGTVPMKDFEPAQKGHYIARKPPSAETQRQILARAGHTTNGRFRDANTGRALNEGEAVWGHSPHYQFSEMRDMAEKLGWTQEQFDEFFEDPAKWQLEYGPTNSGRSFDRVPRQRPVH